jgi:His-Xaa-Ser system radical SAM maturase HxsC
MLKLHARLPARWDADPFVARVSEDYDRPESLRRQDGLLLWADCRPVPHGFRAYFRPEGMSVDEGFGRGSPSVVYPLPPALHYLADGDIVRVSPRGGEISVMYRRNSPSNSLLLTERCNSYCVMCSQPPRDVDDSYLAEAILQAIPLMDPATRELGLTGGEPTLLGEQLLAIVRACKDNLPGTALHMLSNGRMFNYLSLCRELAGIGHPDLVIGIPLYSDIASQHDYVVQARGAFDQTVRGMMNLRRVGVRVEVRVVLHRLTVDRLGGLARFLGRNLPFVDHVALMGLEMMGFVRMNLEALWIDPWDYQRELVQAVRQLAAHRLNVSIYNLPLCVLEPELRPFARQSISDWKNEYWDVCDACAARQDCCGFFASARLRASTHIRPLEAAEYVSTYGGGSA